MPAVEPVYKLVDILLIIHFRHIVECSCEEVLEVVGQLNHHVHIEFVVFVRLARADPLYLGCMHIAIDLRKNIRAHSHTVLAKLETSGSRFLHQFLANSNQLFCVRRIRHRLTAFSCTVVSKVTRFNSVLFNTLVINVDFKINSHPDSPVRMIK